MKEVVGRHNERLEATLDFAAFASRPMPLVSLLDEAPRRIATILRADVCSIDLLEGEGELVMRGNVGFSRAAIGQIRLAIGEGMVGEAVEYMRPILAGLATTHAKYRQNVVITTGLVAIVIIVLMLATTTVH